MLPLPWYLGWCLSILGYRAGWLEDWGIGVSMEGCEGMEPSGELMCELTEEGCMR